MKKLINLRNNNLFKIFNVLIITILLILLYIYDNSSNNKSDPNLDKIEEFESKDTKNFFFSFFFENQISTIKKFRKYNEKDISYNYNNDNNKNNNIPDVSVVITVYNQADCFDKALRSVQNQSLKSIEIIIVNDCSFDNSYEKILKYQKEDNRIILINHIYNFGKIKSRCDAIKLAKGKYITIIDGDDGLSHESILFNSLQIAKIGNLDIVEFKLAYFVNKRFKRVEKNLNKVENLNNRIIYQPELKYKFIILTDKDNVWSYVNRNICTKFIKNEILKQVVEYIGPKYTEDYISIFEDTIVAISLFFISKSYYLMKEVGYYRSKGECEENKSSNNKGLCYANKNINNNDLDPIKYINFLIEKFNEDSTYKKLICNEVITIDYYFDLAKRINKDFEYVFNILDKIIKISLNQNIKKNKIYYIKKELIDKEKKLLTKKIRRTK